MKKKKLTWMLALIIALMTTACSNDENIPGSDGNSNGVITFTVSPDYGVKTRAASAMPAGKALRYILEVYDASNNVVAGSRQVIPVDDMDSPVEFSVEKKPGATYTVVFWADFTDNTNDDKKKQDLYYDTTTGGLKEIALKADGGFEGEAFWGKVTIDAKGTASTNTVSLTHAVAKLTLKTTAQLKNLKSVKVTYGDADDGNAPMSSFNALTGETGGTASTVNKVSTVNASETADADNPYFFHTFYVFAPTDTKNVINMTVEMCTGDNGSTPAAPINIPNVPLQANYQTNITGDFSLAPNKLNIICQAGWTSNFEQITKWNGTYPEVNANYKYSGGEGTEAKPYLIDNVTDFVQMAKNVTDGSWKLGLGEKHFKLTADIDLGDKNWKTSNCPAVFDGDGHTISGLYMENSVDDEIVALFYADNEIIKNLHVKGTVKNTSAGGHTGGIGASDTQCAVITGCSFEGTIYAKGGNVGGIASGATEVAGCKNMANIIITGEKIQPYVGGVVGYANEAPVGCYNTGTITISAAKIDEYSPIGGVVGYCNDANSREIFVSACYSIGTINGITSSGWIDDVAYWYGDGHVVGSFTGKPAYMTDKSTRGYFEDGWPDGTSSSSPWYVATNPDGSYTRDETTGVISNCKLWKSMGSKETGEYPKLWWEK